MSLLVISPNPCVEPDHLLQRAGHNLMHSVTYGQESKTSNSRMRWCINHAVPVWHLVLLFYHLSTAKGRFLPMSSKGACDIFQHLHTSNVSISICPSFSLSQAVIQILWCATGTLRGHVLFQGYYKLTKPSEVEKHLHKFQAKLITTSFGPLWRMERRYWYD